MWDWIADEPAPDYLGLSLAGLENVRPKTFLLSNCRRHRAAAASCSIDNRNEAFTRRLLLSVRTSPRQSCVLFFVRRMAACVTSHVIHLA